MVSCFSKAALEPGRGCAQMALGSYRLRVMPCLVLSQSPCEKRMFPNQLCRYGYVTNSKVKFVMVVDSSNTALRDNEIRSVSVGGSAGRDPQWECGGLPDSEIHGVSGGSAAVPGLARAFSFPLCFQMLRSRDSRSSHVYREPTPLALVADVPEAAQFVHGRDVQPLLQPRGPHSVPVSRLRCSPSLRRAAVTSMREGRSVSVLGIVSLSSDADAAEPCFSSKLLRGCPTYKTDEDWVQGTHLALLVSQVCPVSPRAPTEPSRGPGVLPDLCEKMPSCLWCCTWGVREPDHRGLARGPLRDAGMTGDSTEILQGSIGAHAPNLLPGIPYIPKRGSQGAPPSQQMRGSCMAQRGVTPARGTCPQPGLGLSSSWVLGERSRCWSLLCLPDCPAKGQPPPPSPPWRASPSGTAGTAQT